MFKKIEVIGGFDKDGNKEGVRSIVLERGNIYSIVGKTGSGKTQLVEDIESLNAGEGLTKRVVLIDGHPPAEWYLQGYRSGFIAHLSQNMNYIIDMPVFEFLSLRQHLSTAEKQGSSPEEVLEAANQLAGEKIHPLQLLTKLSGGQSRSLMIADVALNTDAPIILIDEIENAGIDRVRALTLLTKKDKIVLLITHDPLLALYGNQRIVLSNGGMTSIIERTEEEKALSGELSILYSKIDAMRESIRLGRTLKGVDTFAL